VDDGPVTPVVGQIVRILRGRNSHKYAIVIRIVDEKYVMIADGDKRKFDQPKKKNMMHLQFLNRISREVEESIRETGRVTNGKLRFALNQYLESQSEEAQEKGE
jgi:large subunit ribosomal protein L14e